jgi:hypothetical protein
MDGGSSFGRVPSVERATLLCLGAPAPGCTRATLHVFGEVGGKPSLYRSLDTATTWQDVGDPQKAFAHPSVLGASADHFGVVFLGTGGRGIFVLEA